MGLFLLLCGIAAYFGAETVKVNNANVTGVKGLVSAIVMYPLFLILFSFFAWIGSALGLWMYSWFRKIELEFVDGEIIQEIKQNQSSEPT